LLHDLAGIDPDKPLGGPSESPSLWMMIGVAMAIQENGLTYRLLRHVARLGVVPAFHK